MQHSSLGEAESGLLVSVKMQGLKIRNKLKRTPATPKRGREPGLCHLGAIWGPAVSGTETDELLQRALKVFFRSCTPGTKQPISEQTGEPVLTPKSIGKFTFLF